MTEIDSDELFAGMTQESDDGSKEILENNVRPKGGNSKESTKRSSKSKKSKNKRIFIDDLSSYFNNPDDNSPKSPKSTDEPLNFFEPEVIDTQSFTSRVELNIQTYLQTRFLNLREDFTSELQNILIETDCIESEINSFLNDIKVSLRDILSFELPQCDQISQVMSTVDSLCPSFLNTMKSLPDINPQNIEKENENANFATVAINSFTPIMKNSFKSMIDDLSKNLNSLHELQAQNRKELIKEKRHREQLQTTSYQIESQQISQQIESQTIKELSSYISELKSIYNHLDDYDDTYDEDIDDIGERNIQDAISQLKKEVEASQIESTTRLKSFNRKFKDYREEAATMRNHILYNAQVFTQRSMQAMAFAPTMEMNSQFMNPPSSPAAMRYPSIDSPPRVSFPGINNDFSIGGSDFQNRSSELADSVRTRLKEIQERADADLENISSFLQNLRKDEKQRIRSEMLNE